MAESDFMDAFAQKLRERGFDPTYTGYGGGLDKSIQELTEAQGKIKGKPRIDTEALKKKKGRGWLASLTPEERQTVAAYGEYDAARENLASRAAETLNTPKGATMSRQEATQSAVDELARAQREQQYAAPATSTPESPVPTPASSTGFNGEDLRRALIEAPPVPSPMTAPRESDVAALRKELLGAPPVQPAETAPRESDALAAYEDIETGNAPKAIIVDESETQAPEISEDRMSALFRKTMGTAFDPKSKMDASKMNQLREFVGSNPDLLNKSDTKIALDYYRTLK